MVVFSLKGKLKLIIFVIILAVLVALAGYVFTNDAREIVSMVTGRIPPPI